MVLNDIIFRKMKLCNKNDESRQKNIPRIGCKKLNIILESCRKQLHTHKPIGGGYDDDDQNCDGISSTAQHHCSVCEGVFFPLLHKEMLGVIKFLNKRVQRLLDRHLGWGCTNCFIWFADKLLGNHVTLIQECKQLVTYAAINAIDMRNMLKKYDEIHYSKQGQAFKSRAQSMQIEILQSPWLYELIAFQFNLQESEASVGDASTPLNGCALELNEGKPSLSFELFDSIKLDIDLTCSICLGTLFDPVSLSCGHLFCYMCACKAASVSIVDGLKAAYPHKKCPICREGRVYESAVPLEELHILLKRSYPEYWEERRKSEKEERLEQAKTHWQSQAARFMGI